MKINRVHTAARNGSRFSFRLGFLLFLLVSLNLSLPQAEARRRNAERSRPAQVDPEDSDVPVGKGKPSKATKASRKEAEKSTAFTDSPDAPADPSPLKIAAAGATVIDAFTGTALYEKKVNERFFPASTTKILTALLVIENGNLDQKVVIAPEDTKVEPSAIGFKPGDQFTRRDLLYALMLKSANDVAQALARDNAGSVAAFAEKMTRRAETLGATSSHFTNPHGLHNPQHYTTPRDLALISRAAMEQPLFRQIVGTLNYPWTGAGGTTALRNHNRLLTSLEGCTGLKTGYTVPAQQVLVSSLLRNNREVICVVMHTDKPGIWEDSKQLLSYGLTHLPEGPQLE